jgi:glycerate kinase
VVEFVMKIVIAPDHYKESLTALAVATQIEAGFHEIFPAAEYVKVPMTDGGEGTVEAIVAATHGKIVQATVTGPLGNPIDAFFGLTGDGQTAVIEMAAASGLVLIPPGERDPLRTTTFGTGELILAALDAGARRFLIGLGGSATNDGGAGMVQALGGRLLDAQNKELEAGGGALERLAAIDIKGIDPRLHGCRIDVACDVDNPLTGPDGASAVFGPQKGATPEEVARLDRCLTRYAEQIQIDLGVSVADVPGAGAAGGLGAGLLAFLYARLRPGIEIVSEAVGLDRIIADADLVITGEGQIDSQTVHGKTPIGVAHLAKRHGKPVIAIAGSLAEGAAAVYGGGIDAIFSVLAGISTREQALADAAENLRLAARNIASAVLIGMQLDRKIGSASI